jgi:hypothetical protein
LFTKKSLKKFKNEKWPFESQAETCCLQPVDEYHYDARHITNS